MVNTDLYPSQHVLYKGLECEIINSGARPGTYTIDIFPEVIDGKNILWDIPEDELQIIPKAKWTNEFDRLFLRRMGHKKNFLDRLYLASRDEEYESLGACFIDKFTKIMDWVITFGATFFVMGLVLSRLPPDILYVVQWGLGFFVGWFIFVILLKFMIRILLTDFIGDIWDSVNQREKPSIFKVRNEWKINLR